MDQTAVISKAVVIANPESQPLGQISSPPRTITLGPGQAFEIDCSYIVSLFSLVVSVATVHQGFRGAKGFFPDAERNRRLHRLSDDSCYRTERAR